jgi:hypothetical protein
MRFASYACFFLCAGAHCVCAHCVCVSARNVLVCTVQRIVVSRLKGALQDATYFFLKLRLMAIQPRERFFAKLDSKARGSFDLSAAEMFASFPENLRENLLHSYVAGGIRDVSAYVCAQWLNRCRAELAAARTAQEEEEKQAEEEARVGRLAGERNAARHAFVSAASQNFNDSFPTLGAKQVTPRAPARHSAWAQPHAAEKDDTQPRAAVEDVGSAPPQVPPPPPVVHMVAKSGSEEADSTAPRALRFLLGKRVAASWYGDTHIGVVRRIDQCTVQIFWEEEDSQSAVRFEDVLSLMAK